MLNYIPFCPLPNFTVKYECIIGLKFQWHCLYSYKNRLGPQTSSLVLFMLVVVF